MHGSNKIHSRALNTQVGTNDSNTPVRTADKAKLDLKSEHLTMSHLAGMKNHKIKHNMTIFAGGSRMGQGAVSSLSTGTKKKKDFPAFTSQGRPKESSYKDSSVRDQMNF